MHSLGVRRWGSGTLWAVTISRSPGARRPFRLKHTRLKHENVSEMFMSFLSIPGWNTKMSLRCSCFSFPPSLCHITHLHMRIYMDLRPRIFSCEFTPMYSYIYIYIYTCFLVCTYFHACTTYVFFRCIYFHAYIHMCVCVCVCVCLGFFPLCIFSAFTFMRLFSCTLYTRFLLWI